MACNSLPDADGGSIGGVVAMLMLNGLSTALLLYYMSAGISLLSECVEKICVQLCWWLMVVSARRKIKIPKIYSLSHALSAQVQTPLFCAHLPSE